MRTILAFALLVASSSAHAMCTCKANCRKDVRVIERATEQEAIIEAKKHKVSSYKKFGDVWQILVWDEDLICETSWPETCQCDDEKHGGLDD